ncbi:hypothetical protein LOK46_10425 [Methylobacterium sp. NMS14P]|uniref:hypothetical protein n=1 Tax=Methylobacterium sp. NMS14P TaxID=2894310 RepID=UPI002359268C|nr:hypothetical protein [Methylobacterium sp. NMS14P]WCS27204.1 hypothetical protein LOK46_10425 [Methylobacterium sp. NMS14P]
MPWIRDVLFSRFFWLSVLLTIGFAMVARASQADDLGESVRIFVLAAAAIALVTYMPNAMRAAAERPWPSPSSRGVWGVYLLALGSVGSGVFGLLWRLGGFQNFVVNNAVNYYFIALSGVGFMLMVSAPNLFGEGVPPKERILLGSKWVVALGLVLILALTQPDLRWLVEKLRPWLDREPRI